MKVLRAYLRLYLDCLQKTFRSLGKNPWTLVLPIALAIVSVLLAQLLIGGLGRAGSFIWMLAFDALLSCYLYFLSEVVANSKTTLKELKQSVVAYFFPVISVLFVLWVVDLVMMSVMRASAGASPLVLVRILLVAILLNPVPEVIYQNSPPGGLATLQRSFQFLQANWIEWFIFLPNLAIGAVFAFGRESLFQLTGMGIGLMIGGGLLLHLVMVYRGHLYAALDGTTHRQRMYKYRADL